MWCPSKHLEQSWEDTSEFVEGFRVRQFFGGSIYRLEAVS